MKTAGEKLREIMQQDAEAKIQRQIGIERHEFEKRQREEARLKRLFQTFYGDLLVDTLAYIDTRLSGSTDVYPSKKLGFSKNSTIYDIFRKYGGDSQNKDAALKPEYIRYFQDVYDGATQQGLRFVHTYEHDGMGMESWHVVTLEPIEGGPNAE